MMRSETILEFLLVDAFRFFMSFNVSVPPICSGTFPTGVKQTEPSRGFCIGQLVISSQWSSTNHLCPLVQWSERMLGAWSSKTLQACLEAGVVALADALELAACWP
jgi:hypothetical protein